MTDLTRIAQWIVAKRGYQTTGWVSTFTTKGPMEDPCPPSEVLDVFLACREMVRHDPTLRLDVNITMSRNVAGPPPQDLEELTVEWSGSDSDMKLYDGPGVFPYGPSLAFVRRLALDPERMLGSFRDDPRAEGVKRYYVEYELPTLPAIGEQGLLCIVHYEHAPWYEDWKAFVGDYAGDDE